MSHFFPKELPYCDKFLYSLSKLLLVSYAVQLCFLCIAMLWSVK